MRIIKHGKIIPFHCDACGCEFVAGINEVGYYSERLRSSCECPCCGAIAKEPGGKPEGKPELSDGDEQAAFIAEEMSHGQPSAG